MGQITATYLAGFGFGEVLAKVNGRGSVRSALRDRLGSTVGWGEVPTLPPVRTSGRGRGSLL